MRSCSCSASEFQSTLLMRGATSALMSHAAELYFNPRSSCEERLGIFASVLLSIYFNPRSSCEERPSQAAKSVTSHTQFQSTLLMRGATIAVPIEKIRANISIHAPHARSDSGSSKYVVCSNVISIHAPHARSDKQSEVDALKHEQFQSTLLMRGATARSKIRTRHPEFQSTLLMRGATRVHPLLMRRRSYFNPRSSCEERRQGASRLPRGYNFNPRSSCEERRLFMVPDSRR